MSRRKKLVISIAALLALAIITAAAAAIVLYTGSNGQVTGKIESSTTVKALTYSAQGSVPTLVKGTTTAVPLVIANNDPNAPHATGTVTVTFTTSPGACATHLSNAGGLQSGQNVPVGQTINQQLQIAVAGTLPDTCAGADWTATINGTTTP